MLVAQPGNCRNFLCAAGYDNEVGRRAYPKSVGGVRRERRGILEDAIAPDDGTQLRDDTLGQWDALTLAGCSDSANRKSRSAPSRSLSSDVAYEIRTYPGASNASPGVTTTRSLSSSN